MRAAHLASLALASGLCGFHLVPETANARNQFADEKQVLVRTHLTQIANTADLPLKELTAEQVEEMVKRAYVLYEQGDFAGASTTRKSSLGDSYFG